MGKILNIYFNKIIFVEVFDCCLTSQAHQNGCLGVNNTMLFLGRGNSQVTALPFLYFKIAYIS
jgi:hypothetical protein